MKNVRFSPLKSVSPWVSVLNKKAPHQRAAMIFHDIRLTVGRLCVFLKRNFRRSVYRITFCVASGEALIYRITFCSASGEVFLFIELLIAQHREKHLFIELLFAQHREKCLFIELLFAQHREKCLFIELLFTQTKKNEKCSFFSS